MWCCCKSSPPLLFEREIVCGCGASARSFLLACWRLCLPRLFFIYRWNNCHWSRKKKKKIYFCSRVGCFRITSLNPDLVVDPVDNATNTNSDVSEFLARSIRRHRHKAVLSKAPLVEEPHGSSPWRDREIESLGARVMWLFWWKSQTPNERGKISRRDSSTQEELICFQERWKRGTRCYC